MCCSGLLNIVPLRNALSYKLGVLHMSETVTDGSAGGMIYKDADKKVNINYGERPCEGLPKDKQQMVPGQRLLCESARSASRSTQHACKICQTASHRQCYTCLLKHTWRLLL
jgi:hypothetical protein